MRKISSQLANKWFSKAKDDFLAAKHELDREDGVPWIIAFHCQQAVEKYLKGYLVSKNVTPPKIHDLVPLARRTKIVKLSGSEDDLIELSKHYISARYPIEVDEGITMKDARELLECAERIIKLIKSALQ